MMGTALAAGVLVSRPGRARQERRRRPAGPGGRGRQHGARPAPGAGSALSGGGGNRTVVRVVGTCTDSSRAKLKLKPDNGRVEVEFEVDENRNGSRWGVTLKRNGTRVLSRSAVTGAPSGSFEVDAPHRRRLAAHHGHRRRSPRRHRRGLPGDRHALRSAGPGGERGAPPPAARVLMASLPPTRCDRGLNVR